MFTGLVQEMGTVEATTRRGGEAELVIGTGFGALELGESVAVMGACLTVTASDERRMTAFASAETLDRTGLGRLSTGDRVNLERALKLGDPLGGHLVSGHVDAQVALVERAPTGAAVRLAFALPGGELDAQLAPKGSVAVDGVSLTINEVLADRFSVMVIPHTMTATTLDGTAVGSSVNLETDVLAKYVARQLGGKTDGGGVDMELLVKSGFVR